MSDYSVETAALLEVKYEQKQQLVSQQVYSETIWTQQVAFGSMFSKDSNHKFAFAVVLLQAATQPKDVRQSHKLYFKKVYNNDNQSRSLHAVKALMTFWFWGFFLC